MKSKILILIGILITTFACNNNDDDNSQQDINGEYIGMFERNGNTSNVELTFNDGTFTGESEMEKFPALCNGTYLISGNNITFVNDCPWTAEFDWSLILNAEWNFNLSNNILIITKENGDKYTLTKQ